MQFIVSKNFTQLHIFFLICIIVFSVLYSFFCTSSQICSYSQLTKVINEQASILRETVLTSNIHKQLLSIIHVSSTEPINNNSFISTSNENQLMTKDPITFSTTSLLFLGDIMLDRGVRSKINKTGADEVYVNFTKKLSTPYTYTIANLEGPITSWPSKTIGPDGKGVPGFTFTFPTSSANQIKESGIDIVNLANNHTDNFGAEGLRQTVTWLNSAKILFFGNPQNNIHSTNNTLVAHKNTGPTYINNTTSVQNAIKIDSASHTNSEISNRSQTNNTQDKETESNISKTVCETICISYIGFHEFSYKNTNVITDEIIRLRTISDIIIVLPHWGIEYKHIPNTKQTTLARKWIDTGADAVIGTHPHVIQSLEIYNGKPIFYSLGNYLFDQYFSYHTTHGLAVGFVYTSEHLNHSQITELKSASNTKQYTDDIFRTKTTLSEINLIPIDNTNIKTRETTRDDTNIMLNKLFEISTGFVSTDTQSQILNGKIVF